MAKSIGMLLDGFYPSDIRVQKEATALIEAGFKVSLLCKRREGESEFEIVDGISLMRINTGTTHSQKGWMDIRIAINFVHPIFKNNLKAFIDKFSVDVLHVHDLPLVKTAVKVAKISNIKVVADFHENYPEALSIWFKWKKNPLIRLKNKLFFGYRRWTRYENWVSHNVDHIIAVVDEMKSRLVKDHNLQPDKITVVTNTESKAFIKNELDENTYGEDKNKFILAYTGGVGPHRGVDTVIEALGELKSYDDIVFYITGTLSEAAREMIASLTVKYDVVDKVKVLGYRPFSEFYSFMKMASVNIIPHHSNGHTDHTVPHKLFQCMMTGKPLIVSSSTPLKRIVNETKSGLVFEAGNAPNLSSKIVELHESKEKCDKFGANGFESSLKGNYNWAFTSRRLIDFYKNS